MMMKTKCPTLQFGRPFGTQQLQFHETHDMNRHDGDQISFVSIECQLNNRRRRRVVVVVVGRLVVIRWMMIATAATTIIVRVQILEGIK